MAGWEVHSSSDTDSQDVITDDRKRDFRNAERRRIIKRHTSERKNSLLDSLTGWGGWGDGGMGGWGDGGMGGAQ